MICRFRPACPVAALTMHEKVRRQLAICWGVIPFLTGEVTSTDRIFSLSAEVALKERLGQNGDTGGITAAGQERFHQPDQGGDRKRRVDVIHHKPDTLPRRQSCGRVFS